MLVIMKQKATEAELQAVKQYLVDHDYDFHQSTGANRTILGVIGAPDDAVVMRISALPGVLQVFRIPREED